METAQLPMIINNRLERVTLDITEIATTHDIILGIPWLRASNPRVSWRTGQLQWDTPGRDLATAQYSEEETASRPTNLPTYQGWKNQETRKGQLKGREVEPNRAYMPSKLPYHQQEGAARGANSPQGTFRICAMIREVKGDRVTEYEIPDEYQQFKELFSGKLKTGLPQHGPWDHEIPLKPGT